MQEKKIDAKRPNLYIIFSNTTEVFLGVVFTWSKFYFIDNISTRLAEYRTRATVSLN